jgi:hypothetical protein
MSHYGATEGRQGMASAMPLSDDEQTALAAEGSFPHPPQDGPSDSPQALKRPHSSRSCGTPKQVAEKFARRDCGLFQASLFSR